MSACARIRFSRCNKKIYAYVNIHNSLHRPCTYIYTYIHTLLTLSLQLMLTPFFSRSSISFTIPPFTADNRSLPCATRQSTSKLYKELYFRSGYCLLIAHILRLILLDILDRCSENSSIITESEFNLKKTNQILHTISQPTIIARIKCTCIFSPDDQLINTSKIIFILK